jgi:hypothetical protein
VSRVTVAVDPTQYHINSTGLLWTRDRLIVEISPKTHNIHKQTFMAPAKFEFVSPARQQPQTYAFDCAATGISVAYPEN